MATHVTATTPAPPPATAANTNKPFECPHFSCSKSFATLRGLNKHWNYEPTHRAQTDPSAEWTVTPLPGVAAPNPPTSLSEPTSPQKLEASPIQSPPSTPSSPSFSFRTSSRNPTYLSIIRTRRSSNTDQVVIPVETGTKRSRGAATAGLLPSASPTRTMQPNTGEKEPAEEMERDGQPKKSKDGQRKGDSHRPRTQSLSGSDSQPVTDLKRSPVTRSSSSTKSVAFISLPNRKRRKQARGERQKDTSTDVSPDEGPRKELKIEKAEKVEKSDVAMKEAQPQPQQPPVKRKRGRPPKNRNLPPTNSTSTSSASTPTSSVPTSITGTPSSCESATVSLASSLTSPTLSSSAESSTAKTPQPMEESPLPSKKSRETAASSNVPAKSTVNLPLWDSIGEGPQPPVPPNDQTEAKVPPSLAANPQTLPAKPPEIKARGSELPELPPIQPSVLPPTSCPPALSIPSILPKVCSKPEQPPPISSTVGPPSQPSAVTMSEASSAAGGVAIRSPTISPSITTLCTYSTTGNSKAVSESVPATSVVNGKERADAEDGDGGLKSALPSMEAEEPDVVEVKKSTVVEIDLTKGDGVESKVAAETKPPVCEEKATTAAKTPEEQRVLQKAGESPMEVEMGGAAEVGGTKVSPVKKEDTSAKTPQLASRGPQHASTTIPAVTQRPSSVIVSVLSSMEREKKGEDKPAAKPSKAEGAPTTVSSSKPQEAELKPEPRRKLSMTEPSLVPYPPSSMPTYSYSYPGAPYPPPPPMMFPPGGPPPSSMYPPYYPYPSVTQPLPTAYIPPGLGMMPMMEPGGEGLPPMPPYTASHPPIVTTVSGVRVSILDKPPNHLPTVSPHQMPRPRSMPNAPPQQMEHTPQSLVGQPPAIRSFMGAGSPSPDGPPGECSTMAANNMLAGNIVWLFYRHIFFNK